MNSWFLPVIGLAMLVQAAPLEARAGATVKSYHFSDSVKFDRGDFTIRRNFLDNSGNLQFVLECYSLNDDKREYFAQKSGSDPVADLSCYLRDVSHPSEYTILGLPGGSLQFSPAFFWFSDVSRCRSKYVVTATVRGVLVKFEFTNINAIKKTAMLKFGISPKITATNTHLSESAYAKSCS